MPFVGERIGYSGWLSMTIDAAREGSYDLLEPLQGGWISSDEIPRHGTFS
jgi:hypothetical protein